MMSTKNSRVALVCEDDLTSLKVISKTIEDAGFAVIKVNEGELAWKMLELNPNLDIIVTDIGLPDLDGRELIKRIRSKEKYNNIPLVVVSGIIGPKDISSLLQSGVSRLLPKPVQRNDLIESVIRSLEVHLNTSN